TGSRPRSAKPGGGVFPRRTGPTPLRRGVHGERAPEAAVVNRGSSYGNWEPVRLRGRGLVHSTSAPISGRGPREGPSPGSARRGTRLARPAVRNRDVPGPATGVPFAPGYPQERFEGPP